MPAAANAEESASASQELSGQAEMMSKIVKDLAGLVGGSSVQKVATKQTVRNKNDNLPNRLTPLDHAFHQVAAGTGPKESGSKSKNRPGVKKEIMAPPVNPIPLDDNELADFNS